MTTMKRMGDVTPSILDMAPSMSFERGIPSPSPTAIPESPKRMCSVTIILLICPLVAPSKASSPNSFFLARINAELEYSTKKNVKNTMMYWETTSPRRTRSA